MSTRVLACLFVCSALSLAQFQTNQPAASLSINGAVTSGATAAVTEITCGNSFTLNISSTSQGQAYDIAVSSLPQLNPGVSLAGQLVNLDFFGAFSFLSDGATFSVPGLPFGSATWAASLSPTPTALGVTTFQMYAIDPTSAAGLALSQAATLNVSELSTVPLTDDAFSVQALAAPFTFYGVTYSNCYVSSNGFVTFGAGSIATMESPVDFLGGLPSIRTNWDDFNPLAGGTVLFGSEPGTGTTTVQFVNVPEFDTTTFNSFSTTFGGDLVTMTFSAILNDDALVGLSPGGNSAPGFAVDLSAAPFAPIAVDAGSAPYEHFVSGNDLNGLTLRWALDHGGAPFAIF